AMKRRLRRDHVFSAVKTNLLKAIMLQRTSVREKVRLGLLTMRRLMPIIASLMTTLFIHAAPGDLKWSFTTGGAVRSSPALGTNGLVYFGSSDKKVYALEAGTGSKRWQFNGLSAFLSSPALGPDGTVYIGSSGESS